MDRDQEQQKQFTRRLAILGGLKLAVFTTLTARLYYLQVLEADRYATLADDNRVSLRLLAPSRGLISDRYGTSLAANEQNFRVVLTPEQARDVPRVLGLLTELIGLSDVELRRIQRDVQRRRRFVPAIVRENLTWEQVATIEVNSPELPGVSIDVGEIRSYPFGHVTAHVLGYVSTVSEADLKADADPLLSLPDLRIGKSGIERQHDRILRGQAGTTQMEVNAVGRVVRELSRQDGHTGREVRLTLDIGLQQFLYQRLAAEISAAAVVLDVHTGAVLAMCSVPGFDPNLFPGGIPPSVWETLNHDATAPLINKVVGGQYAPGSTFKMMVALAGMESGIAGGRTIISCAGHIELGDHRFHCWRKAGHGSLDMVGALRESCDVYFYEMARRVGIDRIQEMCLRFGLGERTGIDIPGERPGLIPNRAWKQARYKLPWQQGESLVAAIGQGYVLTTPLQLAVMTARLVNGGYAVRPHLTRQILGGQAEQTVWPSIGVQRQSLDLMVAGMNAVVTDPHGTAYSQRITEHGFEYGGKTGTSQVRRITMAERERGVLKNEAIAWRERDHALFVGYAPISAPRYAVSVIVEHGGGGAAIAAPIARDILLETQKRDPARSAPSADGGAGPGPRLGRG